MSLDTKKLMFGLSGLSFVFILLACGVAVWYFVFRSEGYTEVATTPQISSEMIPVDKEAQDFIDTIEEIDMSEDLLIPGNNIGINTVQTSKKNPNLQLRTDPPIPVMDLGPWNNSTIVTHIQQKSLGE